MRLILQNLRFPGGETADIAVESGNIAAIASGLLPDAGDRFADCTGYTVFPGFADVHVHLREPGFSEKETIRTGTLAAAHAGYTDLCAMPNVSPVPDSPAHLAPQLALIERDAAVRVHPYGALTVGERGETLADLAGLAPNVCAFSDDGRGVQNETMMREAMLAARKLGKLIVAHCEDDTLTGGGYLHNGDYARAHGHRGIPAESEWRQLQRDLRLAQETGCAYHACHLSCRESVDLIRQAKAAGANVTAETAPHYLLLDDSMLQEDGRFKMNPPIRSAQDRRALVTGICDGTLDMIATDHAPHTAAEKSRGLEKSLNGIVGLETAFSALYTGLVETGILSLERLVELMSDAPRRRFGLGGGLVKGAAADLCVYDLSTRCRIDPAEFLSLGRSTPFEGWEVAGRCLFTLCGGRTAWQSPGFRIQTK